MTERSASATGRPRRRFWRRAGQVILGLLVVLAVCWVVLTLYLGHEVDAKLAQLRAEGQPLTLAEAAQKPVPDDQNAAVLYQQVFQIDFAHPQNMGSSDFAGLTSEEQESLLSYRRGPSAVAQAAALLDRPEVQAALATLEQASHRPACVFPTNWENSAAPNYALANESNKFLNATTLLTAQALLETRRGHADQACRWFAVAVRMSRHEGAEPHVVAQLIRVVMIAVPWSAAEKMGDQRTASDPYTADLDQALAEQDLTADFLAAMRGERAIELATFEDIRVAGGKGLAALAAEAHPAAATAWRRFALGPAKPLFLHDELATLDFWDRALPFMVEPYAKSSGQLEKLADQVHGGWRSGAILTAITAPDYGRIASKRNQAQAEVELWRLALALQGYKAAHGQYPATLAELQKSLKWTLPADPFSGQAYVYRPAGAGFLVYSFGPDLKDDGGKPLNYGAAQVPQGDIVWRSGS